MESTFLWAYVIGFGISIVTLICFFNLCINVSKLTKHFVKDTEITQEAMPEFVAEENENVDLIYKEFKADSFNLRLTPIKINEYKIRFKAVGLSDEKINTMLK